MVRGLVAWAFFKVEGFEVWARVIPSRSKGSGFSRLVCFVKVAGFKVWACVLDSMSKGSRFGRLGSFPGRKVRSLGACVRFKVEGFEAWSLGLF